MGTLGSGKTIGLVLSGVIVALAAALFYQPLCWLVATWVGDPYYSHGLLVPLISGFLVWRARGKLKALPACPSLWGLGLLSVTLLLAVVAISQQAYFAAVLALPVLAAALTLYLKGWPTLRMLLFPIGYLVLMIPLPLVNDVAFQLQIWTSAFSTAVARLAAVPAQQQGAAISIPGVSYLVGIACSGLTSIIALYALGTLLVYLLAGNAWARMALVASIAPIAMVANGLRLSSVLWVAYHFGGDAGLAYHDTVAGFLSWGLALAGLILGCRVLRCRVNLVASS